MARKLPDPLGTLQPHTLTSSAAALPPQVRQKYSPDRYPLNQNNAFFMNVPLDWTFYFLPVRFPRVVWLGLAPTLFGFGQFFAHGVANNRKLGGVYNPGLAAVVLGHIPRGIWYLVEVYSKGMITVWDSAHHALLNLSENLIGRVVGMCFHLVPNPASPTVTQEHLPRPQICPRVCFR